MNFFNFQASKKIKNNETFLSLERKKAPSKVKVFRSRRNIR